LSFCVRVEAGEQRSAGQSLKLYRLVDRPLRRSGRRRNGSASTRVFWTGRLAALDAVLKAEDRAAAASDNADPLENKGDER